MRVATWIGPALQTEPDIVLVECMDAALLNEQARIVQHLRSQVHTPFLLVPERVQVYVSGMVSDNYSAPPQAFFSLDRQGIAMQRGHFVAQTNRVCGFFQRPDSRKGKWIPHLETVVKVFGDQVLAGDDASITCTKTLPSLGTEGEKALITYVLGALPGEVVVKPITSSS